MTDDSCWDAEPSFEADDSQANCFRGSGRSLNSAGRGYKSVNACEDDSDFGGAGGRGNGRARGRGGATRGRGGRSFGENRGENYDENNRDREKGADGSSEKPREVYIPPEPSNDENEIFAAGISTGINFDNFYNIRVQVSGDNAPAAIDTFESSGLRKYILENVKKSKYVKPTPIQKRAIPAILAGRDLMGCAQTGSGKTAAFLLPILSKLLDDKCEVIVSGRQCQPQVIIISPTRELTIQTFAEARKFAHGSVIRTCIAYGGAASHHQAANIMAGCHILVATAGRLLDFVERKYVSFEAVQFVVLDEADRMLDMGFMGSIEKVMSHPTMVPMEQRQTIMFSATFPESIQHLASQFLNNYIFVTVGILGGACTDVEQVFLGVDKFSKKKKLKELLQDEGSDHTLIFVETKRSADFIAVYIAEGLKYKVTSIHGDRLQRERETALSDFKSGRCNILVATGVAARGLDIKNVSHVINYDLPKTIDEYVHRIGRTGRVGNRGRATSFYDSAADSALASDLVKILQQAEKPIPDILMEAGGGNSSFSNGEFGGEDVRSFGSNAVQTFDDTCESWG